MPGLSAHAAALLLLLLLLPRLSVRRLQSPSGAPTPRPVRRSLLCSAAAMASKVKTEGGGAAGAGAAAAASSSATAAASAGRKKPIDRKERIVFPGSADEAQAAGVRAIVSECSLVSVCTVCVARLFLHLLCSPPDGHTFRVMISTDNHLGYLENDPVRSDDSFVSFRETLQAAKDNQVDFVLLGGDLFHDNKPSRATLCKTVNILRQFAFGESPISFEIISDQERNFPTTSDEQRAGAQVHECASMLC